MKPATTPQRKRTKTSIPPAQAGARRKAGVAKRRAAPSGRRLPAPPLREVRIKALDPIAKCGSRTSVEELYRVEEVVDGRRGFHLVFRDHRGWYCEHGRDCIAVKEVRKKGARTGLTTKR